MASGCTSRCTILPAGWQNPGVTRCGDISDYIVCCSSHLASASPTAAANSTSRADASAARTPGTAVLLLRTAGCDPRPTAYRDARVSRTLASRLRRESAFSACLNDSWQSASDTSKTDLRMEPRYAWVDSMPSSGTTRWRTALNGATDDGHGAQVSYVEWHATVTGPDRYGPKGESPF